MNTVIYGNITIGDLLWQLLCVVAGIILYIRSGKSGKSINNLCEVLMRSPFYRSDGVSEQPKPTSFSNQKTEYELNEKSGMLEVLPDKTDLYEQIQSACVGALDQLLKKYGLDEALQVVSCQTARSKAVQLSQQLDILQSAAEVYDELVGNYGLSADSSLEDMFEFLESRIQEEYNKSKGGDINGTSSETGSPSEQETVQEHGSQSEPA